MQGEMRMNEEKNEIIIVRRGGGGGEEGHHGGTWKIAYADFMTAMMAFFLVMWLVSATGEETKVAIASYFNPIKLVDAKPEPVGLGEDNVRDEVENTNERKDPYPSSNSEEPSLMRESQLLHSPYGTLDTIVLMERGTGVKQGEGGEKQHKQHTAQETQQETPSDMLSQLHDPFSPQYWDEADVLEEEEQFENVVLSDKDEADDGDKIAEKTRSLTDLARDDLAQKQHKLAGALTVELGQLMGEVMADNNTQERPNLQIVPQDEGVLIELSDNKNYGMFDIGSAKPHVEIINLLEGMAKIIATHPGEVVISGHTDQRPYKGGHYDNWQLSSARAQMAYYMLKRGGLDEKRVLRVEGYADRALKNTADPYADENRRIAVFLKIPPAPLHASDMTQAKKASELL